MNDTGWQRLDPRMLLVYPVTEVIKYIPVLLGSVIIGTSRGNPLWSLIPLAVVAGFGATRWFTTTYRIDGEQVQLCSGLLARKTLSIPRSRIRSVDVQADLWHRLLGLAVVEVGTGTEKSKDDAFKLDALDRDDVPALRNQLLAHTSTPEPVADASIEREIAHWRPAWVRYAPLSLTGLAFAAPLVGFGAQFGAADLIFESDAVRHVGDDRLPIVVLIVSGVALLSLLLVSIAACAQYLATWFGLRVVDNGSTLHLRYGLFTTRQITLDLARFRGATLSEPLLLRAAGAAQLSMIMTGENPQQKILPQAPRIAAERTLDELLRTRRARNSKSVKTIRPEITADDLLITGETLGTIPLIPHGPAARRRRYTHAAIPVEILAGLALLYVLTGHHLPLAIWAVLAIFAGLSTVLARDQYRGLGHRVLAGTDGPTWLITSKGSLNRHRDCLEADGIIGWTIKQSFWQRRVGLATVVAATAAGKKAYSVVDLPLPQARALIEEVSPGISGLAQSAGVRPEIHVPGGEQHAASEQQEGAAVAGEHPVAARSARRGDEETERPHADRGEQET
ncbi:PH domain-containing protein [Nocardia camponoti]|uniref:Membrane protein n=1 Tax=Nocardia camponoti TaxID=1616106 RepID=A0A917QGC5_9NOCA|nr:PH domain-containing protein [Nocardia camponoti]GGK47718.1 membrane protein [Nocardia camponoti]